MSIEDEINAMKLVGETLAPLDEEARNRVLQWAVSRFRGTTTPLAPAPQLDSMNAQRNPNPSTSQTFETFAELFEAAHPSTEREKALVAAYWVQICLSQPSFGSQTLNDALKDLGHGVGNITDALTALKEDRPAHILQLKKSGTSKQARKTYKITQEGIRRVQGMLQGDTSSTD